MDRYFAVDHGELLVCTYLRLCYISPPHIDFFCLQHDAIKESLKNNLLVMSTAGVFRDDERLWKLTWDRVDTFLPIMRDEIQLPSPAVVTGA